MIAAGGAAKVIGVESNAAAVRDARMNAQANGVKNAEFVQADATEYMRNTVRKDGAVRPDVVILDPPRAGATEEFLRAVVAAAPSRVVYVSCNMETQARDMKVLVAGGYQVERIQPVDMFPWTGHVECIVSMSKVQK